MSIKSLHPIWHLLVESTSIYLSQNIDSMNPHERKKLENYILERLHALFNPAGKVPTVRKENSPECKELGKAIRKNARSKKMKIVIEKIIRDYKEREKESEYPHLFPPPPWLRKKKIMVPVA